MSRLAAAAGVLGVAAALAVVPAGSAAAGTASCGMGRPIISTQLADEQGSRTKARLTVSVSGAESFSFGYSWTGGATGGGEGDGGLVQGFPLRRTVTLETGRGDVTTYVHVLASYRGANLCSYRYLVDRVTVR